MLLYVSAADGRGAAYRSDTLTNLIPQSRQYPPLLILALIAVSGCGGTEPDEPVRAYLEAIVEGDGARACEQFTAALERDIERAPAARNSGRSCADVMELAAALNPGLTTEQIDELDIDVAEDGDRATARLDNPLSRRREAIGLVKQDGDWKIYRLRTRPRG